MPALRLVHLLGPHRLHLDHLLVPQAVPKAGHRPLDHFHPAVRPHRAALEVLPGASSAPLGFGSATKAPFGTMKN